MNLQIQPKTFFLTSLIVAGALLLITGALWLHRPHHFGKIDRSPFENDMIESLVRGILSENGIRDAPVCFVSFGEGNTSPSADFMARFADCRQPAVRSTGSSVSPPGHRYFEKDTGHSGLIIQILKFNQYIPTEFDVTVSISNLPRGHDRVVYRMSHIAANWTIKKRTPA